VNCIAALSASAFTYDCPSFLTPMIPAPTLYNNGTGNGLNVNITNTAPLDVVVTNPNPIDVTVV
jgi:hypothetical protein